MPDITMCANSKCDKKTKCYRHEASGTEPSEWQSYTIFNLWVDGECEHFLPVREGTNE